MSKVPYDESFKQNAVSLVEAGTPASRVARDLGISDYLVRAWRNIIATYGFRQSMSRKGNCWDNAPMESFFKTMKVELIYPQKYYHTRQEAATSIFEYIEI